LRPSPFFIHPRFSNKNNVNPPLFTPFQKRMCAFALPYYVLVSHAEALRRGVFLVPVVHPGISLTSLGVSVRWDHNDLVSTLQRHCPTLPRFLHWMVLEWLLRLSLRLASSRHSITSAFPPSQNHPYLSLPSPPSSSGSVVHSRLPQLPPNSSSVLRRCEQTSFCLRRSSFPSCVTCRHNCNRQHLTSRVESAAFLVNSCCCCCCWCWCWCWC